MDTITKTTNSNFEYSLYTLRNMEGKKFIFLKSPPQALLGSGFCTDLPPLENVSNFRKGGGSVRNYSDITSETNVIVK